MQLKSPGQSQPSPALQELQRSIFASRLATHVNTSPIFNPPLHLSICSVPGTPEAWAWIWLTGGVHRWFAHLALPPRDRPKPWVLRLHSIHSSFEVKSGQSWNHGADLVAELDAGSRESSRVSDIDRYLSTDVLVPNRWSLLLHRPRPRETGQAPGESRGRDGRKEKRMHATIRPSPSCLALGRDAAQTSIFGSICRPTHTCSSLPALAPESAIQTNILPPTDHTHHHTTTTPSCPVSLFFLIAGSLGFG